MKNMTQASLVALAITSLAGAVSAQSLNLLAPSGEYVQLTGAVDVAFGRVTNKAANGQTSTVNEVHQNGNTGSMLRFRGREDLGGGMFAGFWLEGVFAPDTGVINDAAGRFWNRVSAVYLGGNWGEVAMGRIVAPTFTSMAIYDPVINNGYLQAMKVLSLLGSGVDSQFRNDNAVSYFLPKNLGGLNGHVQISAGENVAGRQYKGARLGYAKGPFDTGISYGTTKTVAGQPNYDLSNIGASYDFGSVKAMGYVAKVKYGNLNQTEYLMGANVPVGKDMVRLTYSITKGTGNAVIGTDSKSAGISYVHNLSMRTAIYADWARVNNSGAANFKVGPSANTGSTQGGYSNGFDIGIRHFF